MFTRETYIALFKTALSGFEELDRFDLIHRKRRRNLSDHSRKHRRGWQLTLAMLGESESPEICHIRARIYKRIYVRRHTPRKGIRLILDTVSRMRGGATQFDTSQLGGVTNAVSHVTASLFSQPPRSATSTHQNHRRLATRTHHLDRRLTTRAH